MRISFIFLTSVYLIFAPVIKGSLPEFELEGERLIVKRQIRKLTAKELIDFFLWRRRINIVVKWMVFLFLLLTSIDSDKSCVLVILGLNLFDGDIFHLDHRIAAYKRRDKLVIQYLQPTRIELDMKDDQLLEAEISRLCCLKGISGRKYVNQKEIGKLFGVSRQMINRRKRVVEEYDLLTLLKRENVTEILRPEVKERIMQLAVSNWHCSDEQIAKTLIEEGWVEKISVGSVHNAIKQMDGCKVRKLMRQMVSKGNFAGNEFSSAYLIKKLFDLLERVMAQLGKKSHPYMEDYHNLQTFKKDYLKPLKTNQAGKYKRDRAYERVKLARDRNRRKKGIRSKPVGNVRSVNQQF